MQLCHRMLVQYCKGESIRCNNALIGHFAKYAIRLTRIDALSDFSEVLIIPRAFVGVALKTERMLRRDQRLRGVQNLWPRSKSRASSS